MKIAFTDGFGIFAGPRFLLALTIGLICFCGIAAGQETAVSGIKVVFDQSSPGVVFIESNGNRIRVDTAKKTVDSTAITAADKPVDKPTDKPASVAPTAKKKRDPFTFKRGEEPFDYRLVNIPTPKNVPRHTVNLVFTHRFTQPIDPLSSSAKTLLGLDSFGIAAFGIKYGITDKLYVSAYRSPLCQRGLCRTIEAGVGYNWLAMDKDRRVALTTYASVEGDRNFSKDFTFNVQAMMAARASKRLYLFFSPAVHLNANGNRRFDPHAEDFFPPATIANSFNQPVNGASFGFGASYLITPDVVALFDFTPRTGFKLGQVNPIFDANFHVIGFTSESHLSMGFGIQRNIGKHAFALTLSNTQTTTTSRYNSSNLILKPQRLVIGFNLSRRF